MFRFFVVNFFIAPSGNSTEHLNPRIVSLQVGETTQSSLSILTRVNFTNPTEYSATVPYADVRVLYNGTAVGHVIARHLSLVPGNNTNASIELSWNPLENGGLHGIEAGRTLISSFISGKCRARHHTLEPKKSNIH